MDVAALSLNIDSSSVLKAANDLDRFSASATKAGAASGNNAGSIAKLVATMQSMDAKLGAIVGALNKLAAANDNVAASARASAAAVTTLTGSMRASSGVMTGMAATTATVAVAYEGLGRAAQQADAHVAAFRARMAGAGQVMQQADDHVRAYRDNLAKVPPAIDTIPPALDRVGQSAGAMQANVGNIAAQFQDIGVTAAMGMNPALIALQQGTQLGAAMQGGVRSLGAAFMTLINPMSLLAIALTAGIALLIQWGMEAWNSADKTAKLGKAISDTQMTTYAFSDAQSALGGVIDLTTGKIKNQSEALYGLARAQLEMIRAGAIRDQAEARKTIADKRGLNPVGPVTFTGGSMTAGTLGATARDLGPNRTQRLLDDFSSGKLTSTQAIDGMERLRKAGKLTEEQFIQLTGAVASFGVAGENLKVYENARKALGGDKAALEPFLDRPKPKKIPKGPKTDAEKLLDIYTGAQADIAAEKARALAAANDYSAEEALKLEKQTAMLNQVQQRGIPITDAVRTKIAGLADEYARLKIEADTSEAFNATTRAISDQQIEIADQVKLIGLYGDELDRARREQEAQRQLRASLPKGAILVSSNLTGGLSDETDGARRLERAEKLRKESEDMAFAMDRERGALGLTREAALQYGFVTDKLVEAKRAGIALSPAEVAAIEAAGSAYAQQRQSLDDYARKMSDTREVARGFLSDLTGGLRDGANAFTALADSAMNALNRIIDKLLDRTLDSFLDGMFKTGSAGGTGSQFGRSNQIRDILTPNALGGVYGAPERFGKGGAFTNSIVTSPTLFRFAKGSALGEMGEAGPEAIMPLKRGPNGSLGVQMHGGGRPSVQMGDVHLHQSFAGAVGIDSIRAMNEQSAREAVSYVRRNFADMAAEYEQNGVIAA
ncbi:phage tail length tape measure family protein [Sphingomonas paucimobilis]|uniref:phage tail length tape measure family protein n=1 Tax=Sphingomonas paucimobilis TaxID=13689 RepID=UPI00243047F9|nr:phage tail length tape measure family protein [Sphingomonas paucimobilis]